MQLVVRAAATCGKRHSVFVLGARDHGSAMRAGVAVSSASGCARRRAPEKALSVHLAAASREPR